MKIREYRDYVVTRTIEYDVSDDTTRDELQRLAAEDDLKNGVVVKDQTIAEADADGTEARTVCVVLPSGEEELIYAWS